MRSKVLKYHHSGYLYNLADLRILSQLYDDVQADFEAKRTNSCSPQTIRLYIQFIDTYFSDKELLESKSNNNEEIVTDLQQIFDSQSDKTNITGRAKYSLNGGEPQNKRSIVRSVVSLYMKLHPRSTWSKVLEVFPKELQGSYGVVASVENIQYRIKKGFDDEKRYFLDPSSQFTTIDGVVFAVCHQWGNQFDKFREYVEDKLGWMIEEV